MSGFNKFLLTGLLAWGAYSGWNTYHGRLFPLPPLYQKPYIVVYGSESCGFCQAMKKELTARSIHFVWKRIDQEPARGEIFSRMKKSGLDTSYFMLPVVDVNARILVHPEAPQVAAQYRL